MACSNDNIISFFLPDTFKYKVLEYKLFDDQNFECHIRIALKHLEDFRQWLHDFEEKTNTSWIVKKSHLCSDKTSYVVNRNYVCQHSSFRKRQKVKGTTKKDKSCEAAFTVRIKRNNSCIRYHDPHVKDGLTAVVKISFVHSHSINDADSWSWLRRSKKTRDIFINYFEKGMSPIEAISCHQDSLLSDPEQLSNSRKNPPKAWVYALHEKWMEEKPIKVATDSTKPIMIPCHAMSKQHNNHTTPKTIFAVPPEPNHNTTNSTEPIVVKYELSKLNFSDCETLPISFVSESNQHNLDESIVVKCETSILNLNECDPEAFSEIDTEYVFQKEFTNSKEEVLEKWDAEMSRLRNILKDNITDRYFRSRIDTFLNVSSSVWTKDQMCALLEMGTL